MSRSRFEHYPNAPSSAATQNAYVILCRAHEAASSFLEIFEKTRKTRGAKGTSTDKEQDLLRAMLVFAGAGLDSMIKQLVRDALSHTIDRSEGAERQLEEFISRRLSRADPIDRKFLSSVLSSRDPRDVLVSTLVDDLTSQSVQSKEQVLKVASHFEIPSDELTTNKRGLESIFRARNEIVHEMDVDFDRPNRNHRPRTKEKMISHTTELLRLANSFLIEVDRRLCQPTAESSR